MSKRQRERQPEEEPISGSDVELSDGDGEQQQQQCMGDGAPRRADRPERKRSGGSFQTMGLTPALFKAVQRKGFRLPTPIQRKCIPPLLEGRDVVGMARTGSGKTAAFLLPLLQCLRAHSIKVGIRGLILSPSRELALQTFGVLRELAKLTDLRSVMLVGGDGVEEQFAQLATNPDIVVATPGRLMHLCVETRLSLQEVQFVVWDEADRLMEDPTMGKQMREINARLPETRQTALFSATLPKALAEFAQAGLRNPLLVRLDVESKLSPDLKMSFLHCQSEGKDAALLLLLHRLLGSAANGARRRPTASDPAGPPLTVIFVATKHHVEYLQELLTAFNLPCTYIYGALDQIARKQALDQFRRKSRTILIVTDVAARGLDIPLLDNVINYDYPPTPKLFVHRVGRVARAGRPGHAYSLVCPDELPYLFDLQLFLGHPLVAAARAEQEEGGRGESGPAAGQDRLILGSIPQSLIDEEREGVLGKLAIHGSLSSLCAVMKNACKLYRRTRPPPSPEAHRRCREFLAELPLAALGIHPLLEALVGKAEIQQASLVQAIHQYKPKTAHLALTKPGAAGKKPTAPRTPTSSSHKGGGAEHRDAEHYLQYVKAGAQDEAGYSIVNNFAQQARGAIFDLGVGANTNEDPMVRKGKSKGRDERTKLIRTEMGTKVPASFRTDAYEKWRAKTRLDIQRPGELESTSASSGARAILSASAERRKWRGAKRGGSKRGGKRGGKRA